MSKAIKIVLVTSGGLVALVVLTVVALLFFVDADTFRPRLEGIASAALGMEITVQGPLEFSLLSGLGLTLEKVQVRQRGTKVASAAEVRLGIKFLPLLRREIRIGSLAVQGASFAIVKDREGNFNSAGATAAADLPGLELAQVSLTDVLFRYVDRQSGTTVEGRDCSLQLPRLRLAPGNRADLMQHLFFSAELACAELQVDEVIASDLRVFAGGANGVYELAPVTMQLFGGAGTGSIRADFSGAVPQFSAQYSLPQFSIEEFFKTQTPDKVATGTMTFFAQLSLQGATLKELRQSLAGQFSLRGSNLILVGRDLDEEFSRYESSQNFNLVDLGAFFFAGPLGTAVTKGFNFASNLQESGGTSAISRLVSDWQIEQGMAQARDVAMATRQHRVALQGRLDLVNQQFDDMTMALIDAEGCAQVRQTIRGNFRQPVVEPPSILRSLTGPIRELLQMGKELLPGGECDVFYAGSVAPPE